MSTTTAAVLIGAVALVGFYLLAAYIVYTTGTTAGIADIGRTIAAIVSALIGRGTKQTYYELT